MEDVTVENVTVEDVTVEVRAYDHPDVAAMIESLQAFYRSLYGGTDRTRVDPTEFSPPGGLFLVAYASGRPVACGGWRTMDSQVPAPGIRVGDAEIKRMYVLPSERRLGLGRLMLSEVERTARAAGRTRLILETGRPQVQAIALYESAGYLPVDHFGIHDGALCLGKSLAVSRAAK